MLEQESYVMGGGSPPAQPSYLDQRPAQCSKANNAGPAQEQGVLTRVEDRHAQLWGRSTDIAH